MRSTKVTWICDFCSGTVEGATMPAMWRRYTLAQLDAKGRVQDPVEFSLCGPCVGKIVDQTAAGFLRAILAKFGRRR